MLVARVGRNVKCVRRLMVLLCASCMILSLAHPAFGQGKDPFKPPVGPVADAGQLQPGDDLAPAAPANPSEPAGSDGLARTGQDVGGLFAAGVALVALGLGMALLGRVMAPGGRLAPSLGNRA